MHSAKLAMRLIARYVLGATFIFSGFVKVVDPWGFAYKLQDYFVAFHVDWLNGLALLFALLLSAAELFFGLLLILDEWRPVGVWGVAGFMLFFTPLTFVLAVWNPVSDCGCFGDVVKLSNWATFWKNLVLCLFLLPLLLGRWKRDSFTFPTQRWRQYLLRGVLALLCLAPGLFALRHLPLLDFRPYHLGASILEGMAIPEGAPEDEYLTTFIYEKNGEQREFNESNYPWDDSTWTYVSSTTELVREGYKPPIANFILLDSTGQDVAQSKVLAHEYAFLAVSPFLEEISAQAKLRLQALRAHAQTQHVPLYLASSSSYQVQHEFKQGDGSHFHMLTGDERVLKTVIRAKPGVVLFHQGVVIGKWNWRDLPDLDYFQGNMFSKQLTTIAGYAFPLWGWGLALGVFFCRLWLLYVRYAARKGMTATLRREIIEGVKSESDEASSTPTQKEENGALKS